MGEKFDVTMGSYDRAETCELVGCYLISILTKNTVKTSDFTGATVWEHFNVHHKRSMCKTFGDNDLKITMQANITVVNFLDITLDLKSGKHLPSLNQEMFLRTFK